MPPARNKEGHKDFEFYGIHRANTNLIRCSSIGGKTWRKKEVSLSMLWKTSELCQRRTATQRGPKERVKLAWNHVRLWGKNRACAMHEMLIR